MGGLCGATRVQPQSCKDAFVCKQRISIHPPVSVGLASIVSFVAFTSTSSFANLSRTGLMGPQ